MLRTMKTNIFLHQVSNKSGWSSTIAIHLSLNSVKIGSVRARSSLWSTVLVFELARVTIISRRCGFNNIDLSSTDCSEKSIKLFMPIHIRNKQKFLTN